MKWVALLTLLALSPTSLAAQESSYVKAIDACVKQVHGMQRKDDSGTFFKGFDAYYNPSDGRIYNNARRNGDMPPLYEFNKCMVKKGLPLIDTSAASQKPDLKPIVSGRDFVAACESPDAPSFCYPYLLGLWDGLTAYSLATKQCIVFNEEIRTIEPVKVAVVSYGKEHQEALDFEKHIFVMTALLQRFPCQP